MGPSDREIIESPIYQGADEYQARTLTTTPWGSAPTAVAVVVKDSDGTDVSGTTLTGVPAVVGDVITLPALHSLTAGMEYRMEVKFTSGGNIHECWARVVGQK